jgi:hypothetical protein
MRTYSLSRPTRPARTLPGPAAQGWLLREEVQLGMRDLVPTAISRKTILRGITDKGHYIWRAGRVPA